MFSHLYMQYCCAFLVLGTGKPSRVPRSGNEEPILRSAFWEREPVQRFPFWEPGTHLLFFVLENASLRSVSLSGTLSCLLGRVNFIRKEPETYFQTMGVNVPRSVPRERERMSNCFL